ncbi:hypothetical protein HN681_04715 [archaeon]|jgi:hypothetical protein|nr:hypothetical protein [archaeon]MBT3731010.1 hypothetical protein [archaeon]MBT4669752.1 hypothetical protein [archaeon]MBT5029902.1 hypothetical protein [archaeon]MBT5288474.1 hypothetical protein [archaeon]
MDTVRERLERLKAKPRRVGLPLSEDEINPRPEKVLLSPESIFMRKIEKLMSSITSTKKKMLADSGQYLSLYYDLKKQEKEFLETLDDPELQYLDIPDIFMQKINNMKKRIIDHKF